MKSNYVSPDIVIFFRQESLYLNDLKEEYSYCTGLFPGYFY